MTFAILPRLAATALFALSGALPPAAKKLNVVTTTPDLAALVREIGGDAVDVKTLAKPSEDPHFVDAKPSHIVTLNRADVLIEGGAELEVGWLPPLLESARNDRLAAGSPGLIIASQGIRMIEIRPPSTGRAVTSTRSAIPISSSIRCPPRSWRRTSRSSFRRSHRSPRRSFGPTSPGSTPAWMRSSSNGRS